MLYIFPFKISKTILKSTYYISLDEYTGGFQKYNLDLDSNGLVKIKVDLSSPELPEKEHHSTAKSLSEIDLFSTESIEFSEKLKETREKNYASERLSSQRKELKAAISINEKFLFINE